MIDELEWASYYFLQKKFFFTFVGILFQKKFADSFGVYQIDN